MDHPRPETSEPLGSRPPEIRTAHLQKLAVVYARQSSPEQVRNHTGSAAAQRDLAELARRWGWPEARIRVIDSDLGLSGTSALNREGFQELTALVRRSEIGMILAQDASRLTRNFRDFADFVEGAADTDTLICVNGVIYDPASPDFVHTLGLQVQGLFGAFDNKLRASRFREARIAKARRGHAVSAPPIGYVQAVRGQWVKDPDLEVQHAIQRAFALYQELGSLGKVVNYHRDHHLLFPRRLRGRVTWRPLDAALLDNLLRNPAYVGDYVFGRFHSSRGRAGQARQTRRPRSEWIVAPSHHEPYVPRDVWQRIQDQLASRRPGLRPMLGKGTALLQGLLRCGDCYRWMRTQYWGRHGTARTATYVCRKVDGWGQETHRVAFPAVFVEQAVVHHVLGALTAVDAKTACTVIQGAEAEVAALTGARRRRLQAAEAEVHRLRETLLSVPPEFTHVHVDLVAQLEDALRRHDALKTELGPSPAPAIGVGDVDELVALTRDVRQLWAADTTTNEDRKRLLRTVIGEIIVKHATKEVIELEVVWAGGARQPLRALRPRGVDTVVREQAQAGKSARRIIDELNAAGIVTASGRPISLNVVAQKLGAAGLRLKHEWQTAHEIIRHGMLNHVPRPEILQHLRDRAPRLAPWTPQRLSVVIGRLQKVPPERKPLPAVLPGERQKQAVLERIDQGLAAGDNWTTIAARLNESELRPPRGPAFNPNQIRLLYMRARGLRSFKLASKPPEPLPILRASPRGTG